MTVQHLAQKRHRLRKLRGETAYIDAAAARLHLATLLGAGWSLRSIAGTSGVSATTLSRLNRGGQTNASPQTITAVLKVDPKTIANLTNRRAAEPFVSRTGTTRRLQALLFLGWGHQQMREHCGLNTAALLHQQGRWVTRSTHDAVATMYRELSSRRGPSTKANAFAVRLGYRGPADWSDIDRDVEPDTLEEIVGDVDEVAVERVLAGDTHLSLTPAEKRLVVARWHETGRPLADLERAGWNTSRYRAEAS
ncbi:hypothetical protein ASE01_20000 [Nocardioides sp. Root190]|uniref:hypothetical protein n=1 Tax=Nocardioides sp. Root190 TaxID=1736488 RepID=UPI0006F852EF|nr:hypothetical protein [Nocardioides sp. Root190]KRB73061.1 hypothetical protein ASE01_20000 [Nocardioides sp. Root190]